MNQALLATLLLASLAAVGGAFAVHEALVRRILMRLEAEHSDLWDRIGRPRMVIAQPSMRSFQCSPLIRLSRRRA